MTQGWVYLNGAFLPAAEARVAADDTGLLFGHGVFETFRARRGRVCLLERHRARLGAGAQRLGIPLPPAADDLEAIVRELVGRCGLEDARVRLTLTAGTETGGPTLLLQARAATDYPSRLYEEGSSAVISPVRRNETSPLCGIKSLNCLDNLLARSAARGAGAEEALLLNSRGRIAEGSASNLFLVREGALLTPPLTDGALPGVTRSAVLELAATASLSAREESLSADDLFAAEEAFLTSAIAGVLPLVRVDGRAIGPGAPGRATLRLHALYEAAAAG